MFDSEQICYKTLRHINNTFSFTTGRGYCREWNIHLTRWTALFTCPCHNSLVIVTSSSIDCVVVIYGLYMQANPHFVIRILDWTANNLILIWTNMKKIGWPKLTKHANNSHSTVCCFVQTILSSSLYRNNFLFTVEYNCLQRLPV